MKIALAELIKNTEPNDAIWQEAIRLSDSIDSQYEVVFNLTLEALSLSEHTDTIAALSTCLIEHLLEYDFSGFERLEQKIRIGDDKALLAVAMCAKFGASKIPANAARWESLLAEYSPQLAAARERYGDIKD